MIFAFTSQCKCGTTYKAHVFTHPSPRILCRICGSAFYPLIGSPVGTILSPLKTVPWQKIPSFKLGEEVWVEGIEGFYQATIQSIVEEFHTHSNIHTLWYVVDYVEGIHTTASGIKEDTIFTHEAYTKVLLAQ